MPPIGLVLGKVDFSNLFAIVGFVVYSRVRSASRCTPKPAAGPATTKDCPYCVSKIPLKAGKCAFCGSDVTGRG